MKKEICDFCCAEKSAKILKATAFFFFLSFEENFLFRFFQSVRGKKQPINFSLLFFFKHDDLYSHTLCGIPAKHYRKSFLRAREREIQREMSGML